MKKFILYFATLASFNCLYAHAEIYKCKEKSGEIVFMDGNSKQILMSELELEQKALATAKTQRPSGVLLHEKNIELLKKRN